jgi:hypothetical protein
MINRRSFIACVAAFALLPKLPARRPTQEEIMEAFLESMKDAYTELHASMQRQIEYLYSADAYAQLMLKGAHGT